MKLFEKMLNELYDRELKQSETREPYTYNITQRDDDTFMVDFYIPKTKDSLKEFFVSKEEECYKYLFIGHFEGYGTTDNWSIDFFYYNQGGELINTLTGHGAAVDVFSAIVFLTKLFIEQYNPGIIIIKSAKAENKRHGLYK